MIPRPGFRAARCRAIPAAVLICILGSTARPLTAQIPFDRAPINYSASSLDDPVVKLQQRIDSGQAQLSFDGQHGYLKSVLKELNIATTSQMLVFSKTSFQQRLITPWSPRALYFNDNTYVGWVPRGDVIELSSVDPRQGAIFYTLRQQETDTPQFVRDRGNCLTCHASSRTQGVPGHLVRSVYPSRDGLPHFGSGTFRTNHTSPLKERWGGWYVTGTHGHQRHMGNVVALDRNRPEQLDVDDGANITDLRDRTRIDEYLADHSDIVALMVLEHQSDMHNLITHASYEARLALHANAEMNKLFERPADHLSDSTKRRLNSATEKLVRYMLFVDEARLSEPIEGTSEFAREFARLGPTDAKGRSLRQFDLEDRLFKHPCSYLVYSAAFQSLPEEIKRLVYGRLWEVLTGPDDSDTFDHLSAGDRLAILEILQDTVPDLTDYWDQSRSQ